MIDIINKNGYDNCYNNQIGNDNDRNIDDKSGGYIFNDIQ